MAAIDGYQHLSAHHIEYLYPTYSSFWCNKDQSVRSRVFINSFVMGHLTKTLITTILDKTMTKVSTLTSIEQQLSQHSSAHGPESGKNIKKKNKPSVSR